MKRLDFTADTLAAIVYDIDQRTEDLRQAELDAMANEEIAERRFFIDDTPKAYNELNAAIAATKKLRQTIETLEKLSEGLYSASVAFSDLSSTNENELKILGLV